ncbi:MAG: 50S ribosomal protein L18e [Candidatus Nezhaarchaeota archaeon]|nr:50S ribosomal protein L18e [Candidatus Nezhaarchaeota archaeon]MCX8141786.1 50S ribosomal protein L18e [Candidatus Nezhaarchaeota archaeon]MDW8050435.1 50S ribosomal protein L18e [Nitrososphaerota archaeon]
MEVRATNPMIRKVIITLRRAYRQYHVRLWRDLIERINVPKRRRNVVNVSRINRYTNTNDVVVVPGKVLGAGVIDHPVTVAALWFSKTAREKIVKAGGRSITIEELIAEKPSGSGVKIIG